MSADGQIKQKLVDLPGDPWYIGFDVTRRRLIVHYWDDTAKLNHYNIESVID